MLEGILASVAAKTGVGLVALVVLLGLYLFWRLAKRQGAKEMGLDFEAQVAKLEGKAKGVEKKAYKHVYEILKGKHDAKIFGPDGPGRLPGGRVRPHRRGPPRKS